MNLLYDLAPLNLNYNKWQPADGECSFCETLTNRKSLNPIKNRPLNDKVPTEIQLELRNLLFRQVSLP